MAFDPDKLDPAPWFYSHGDLCRSGKFGGISPVALDRDHKEFLAVARNAFDVMMRRGWMVHFDRGLKQWVAVNEVGVPVDNSWYESRLGDALSGLQRFHDDPFTALVEADKWYRENVEKQG